MTTLLEVRSVGKHFGGLSVFTDVSFELGEGRSLGLIGPNGAGKSTLAACISGFLRPDAGVVTFAGVPTSRVSPDRLCRAGMARTFQHPHLLASKSAFENVLVGTHSLGRVARVGALWRSRRIRNEEQGLAAVAYEAMAQVACDGLADRSASTLTAGQQRLVAVARALASRPRLVILDEPAAGLNETETGLLTTALLSLKRHGISLLIIEHDLDLVATVSDRMVVLAEGALIADDTPDEVRQSPQVIEAYVGGALR